MAVDMRRALRAAAWEHGDIDSSGELVIPAAAVISAAIKARKAYAGQNMQVSANQVIRQRLQHALRNVGGEGPYTMPPSKRSPGVSSQDIVARRRTKIYDASSWTSAEVQGTHLNLPLSLR